jgi:hypothetical protein
MRALWRRRHPPRLSVGEHLVQQLRWPGRTLDLIEAALPGRLVGPPAQEVRAMAESIARDLIVFNLGHQLGLERLPVGRPLRAPSAGGRSAGTPCSIATTSGKKRARDLPDFARISTSSPARKARQRKPSNFGSNCYPGSSGRASTRRASIGSVASATASPASPRLVPRTLSARPANGRRAAYVRPFARTRNARSLASVPNLPERKRRAYPAAAEL